MPADLFARLDLDKLYFPFLERIFDVVAECRAKGTEYFATRGFATYGQQMSLWQQGRLTPGKRVTNARGGESPHNFGLAIDFCPDLNPATEKLDPDWRPESFLLLGDVAKRHGLVWGGDFPAVDRPHVQWPGFVNAKELQPIRTAFDVGGLEMAWKCLENLSGKSAGK